jgi:hypothetical protein
MLPCLGRGPGCPRVQERLQRGDDLGSGLVGDDHVVYVGALGRHAERGPRPHYAEPAEPSECRVAGRPSNVSTSGLGIAIRLPANPLPSADSDVAPLAAPSGALDTSV